LTKPSPAAALTTAQLQGILGIADDAVVCFDERLHILLFNHGAEMIFGWTREEAIGQMIDLLLPPHVRAGHSKLVADFGRSGDVARRMGERRAISGMRKSGEEFPAEASISKLETEGTVIYTAILRDITAQVSRERELKAAKERAEAAMQAKSSFLANDESRDPHAHERRDRHDQPAGHHETHDEQEEYVNTIRVSGESLLVVINDILDFSKIEVRQDGSRGPALRPAGMHRGLHRPAGTQGRREEPGTALHDRPGRARPSRVIPHGCARSW
jgi:PAS domain S-box-containing protein